MLLTRPDAGLDWILVHIGNLSDQIVFFLVKKLCTEYTGCDWPRTDSYILQLLNKLQVLVKE